MFTGLLGVLPFAPRPGWKEVVVAVAAMFLGTYVFRKCPSNSWMAFRVTVACGVGGLIAMLVGQRDSFDVPQLVLFSIAGSLLGVLFARLAIVNRPSP